MGVKGCASIFGITNIGLKSTAKTQRKKNILLFVIFVLFVVKKD